MLNQPNKYAPDVLDCIANLSNDEVFTSPKLANEMLDIVPQELFTSPDTKFLDPCCKSGVFLREIVKRLDKGLENIIPDKQERIDHIMKKQVFGIAVTELTAQLSRRTVYCSKYACKIPSDKWVDENGMEHNEKSYSVSEFVDSDKGFFCTEPINGNIRLITVHHDYDKSGTCKLCGANKNTYGDTGYAYEFIHMDDKTTEVLKNMQFDLIIGNPPYQLSDSSDSASAKPIYNNFVEQAKKLQPRYLAMIIPSRWMSAGKGLDKFRDIMIHDKHITKLVDFVNSKDCFSGVDIKGGVCYFLREKDREAKCEIETYTAGDKVQKSKRYLAGDNDITFIRFPELVSIKDKVWADDTQTSFKELVSVRKPYGFCTDFFKGQSKYGLPDVSDTPIAGGYEIVGLVGSKRTWKYVPADYPFPKNDGLGKWKIFEPNAYGCGAIGETPGTPILGTPILGTPIQACTETFLEIGTWDTKEETEAALKYLKSKFFRCMVGIIKQTQHTSVETYRLVPMQNFTPTSDIDWSQDISDIDKQLYEKYELSDEDIKFIEDNIQEME